MIRWATIAAAGLAATLAGAQVLADDEQIPGCDRGVLAGRTWLPAGEPAPVDCACYDADAETCQIMRYRRCRADLSEAGIMLAAEHLASQAQREALQQALLDAADELERARSDLEAARPAWWDRAWIGSAATVVVSVAIVCGGYLILTRSEP
jgi:hypothetical protein